MWIQEREKDCRKAASRPAPAPIAGFVRQTISFSTYLARVQNRRFFKERGEATLTEAQRQEAIRGVTGMMLFADFDNPILQEALGDLLSTGTMAVNADHLHAGEKTQDPAGKAHLDRRRQRRHQGVSEEVFGEGEVR